MAFDGPVCLARSAPHAAYVGKLAFYDVIDSRIYSQSSVLSGIVKAGGEAVLPSSITLAEFKAWLLAVEAKSEEVKKWSFASFCTVLKVADILGDGRLEDWIKLAADSLPPERDWLAVHGKSTCNWTCSPEEASQGIENLTRMLRRRIFAASAVDSERLRSVLDFLPSKHHAEVLEACITNTKTLAAPLCRTLHVAKALALMQASPASFLSLDVHEHPHKPIEAASTAAQEAPVHLEQALRHHSSLTSLQLKLPCITTSSLKLLSPAIASLKSMQALLLHTGAGADSFPMIQQTLASLSDLQRLSISFASSATLKRQRDDQAADIPQHCMSPMLSAATALTSLELLTTCEAEYVTATSAVSLPQLRHLVIRFACEHTSAAADLLSHLSAPLTSLDMHHDSGLSLPPAAAPDALRLCSSLVKFTDLHTLTIATPRDDRVSSQVILDAVAEAFPPALAALPRLSALSITTELPVIHLAMQRLITAHAGLTELILSCSSKASDAAWEAWPEFLQHLSPLKLHRLRITLPEPRTGELPGLAALPPLQHLTALSLDGWQCLSMHEDCAALASMTQLQKLHLAGMRLPRERRVDCSRSLGALPALTSLLFHSATVKGSISGVLDKHVPEGALPLLQELGVDIWWPSMSDDEASGEESASELEGEDEGSGTINLVVDTIVSIGGLAERLPAVTQLDVLLEPNGFDCLDDELDCLENVELESKKKLQVTYDEKLPS